MISGFNTDIEHDGKTFHVQTEDKGLETPLILSLVYAGGEILAAKRQPYDDLIASGFDEKVLSERLQRQHKLICAAIKQGRLEDLKRMSGARETAAKTKTETAKPKSAAPHKPAIETAAEAIAVEAVEIAPVAKVSATRTEPKATEPRAPEISANQPDARILRAEADAQVADFVRVEPAKSNALNLKLIGAREFRGGDRVALQIHVSQGKGAAKKDVLNAEIMIKVLGAAFRPIILHANTADKGVATIHLQLPSFKTGRAAILIRASHDGYEAELRRIVAQG